MDRSSGELAVTVWMIAPRSSTATRPTVRPRWTGTAGTALMGDLDDADQDLTDAEAYVDGISAATSKPWHATTGRGWRMTVSDAALMAQCQYWDIAHEHPDSMVP